MKKTDPKYEAWIRNLRCEHMTRSTYWNQISVGIELIGYEYRFSMSTGINDRRSWLCRLTKSPNNDLLIRTGYGLIATRWFEHQSTIPSAWWLRNNRNRPYMQQFIRLIRDQIREFKRQNANVFVEMRTAKEIHKLTSLRHAVGVAADRALDYMSADDVMQIVNDMIVSRTMEG